jgi:16S rRNA processing protein RimM
MSLETHWVAVGRVTRAHGVHGEVAVLPLSIVESRFQPGSRLFLGESDARPVTVRTARPHRDRLIVAFEEVGDRTEAEALRAEYLFVPAEAAPELPQGEYWPHQLVGCAVVTDHGTLLGEVREVIHTAANDVWLAGAGSREVLIPALRDVVTSVDLKERRIVVREIAGLTIP